MQDWIRAECMATSALRWRLRWIPERCLIRSSWTILDIGIESIPKAWLDWLSAAL
jgi:hypothetical protein